jgi:hypothetical protein
MEGEGSSPSITRKITAGGQESGALPPVRRPAVNVSIRGVPLAYTVAKTRPSPEWGMASYRTALFSAYRPNSENNALTRRNTESPKVTSAPIRARFSSGNQGFMAFA